METLVKLICMFLFGTVIVVGFGIMIQLSMKRKNKQDDDSRTDNNQP